MDTIYAILATIHQVLWLIVIIFGLVGLLKAVLSLSQRAAPAGFDRNWYRGYSAVLGAQVLVGILLVIANVMRGAALINLVHGLVMLIAIGVAQMFGARARRQGATVAAQQSLLLSYLLSLLLIVIGLAVRQVVA